MPQYTVHLRCTITKVVTTNAESAEAARENPFRGAVDECETDLIDWEVTDVRESR